VVLARFTPETWDASCRRGVWLARLCFCCTASSPTAFYTLSLHDALPISLRVCVSRGLGPAAGEIPGRTAPRRQRRHVAAARSTRDRKSTRLNSSHDQTSYAVFCLKKKSQRVYSAALVNNRIRTDRAKRAE